MSIKVYTKTGDKGKTGLFSGERVEKDNVRVRAYGAVDELNSILGWCLVEVNQHGWTKLSIATPDDENTSCGFSEKQGCIEAVNPEEIQELLEKIQTDLFALGSDLATPFLGKWKYEVPRIEDVHIEWLESIIDEIEKKLPPLKTFLLPGGTELASRVHIARVVCRRAERNTARALRETTINPSTLRYLNRLSDLLFVLARLINNQAGIEEKKYIPAKKHMR